MAKVIIDASAFSLDWFRRKLADDLLSNPKVKFVFSTHDRMMREIEKNEQYAKLFRVLEGDSRRVVVSEQEFDRLVEPLTSAGIWTENSKICDDEHVFVLVRSKRARFVFTKDSRMARCRDCIRSSVKSEYCSFVALIKEKAYLDHREQILS